MVIIYNTLKIKRKEKQMKNREFYREEILKAAKSNDICKGFINTILHNGNCIDIDCDSCQVLFNFWLEEEYEEPEVDWSKVEVDTPILVSDDKESWRKRYFAEFENSSIYAWESGATSWSVDEDYDSRTTLWKYAKLAEKE